MIFSRFSRIAFTTNAIALTRALPSTRSVTVNADQVHLTASQHVRFSRPVQFADAVESRQVRSILQTDLGSAELERISADILERALFSARVNNAEYLQTIATTVNRYMAGEIDLATARLALKDKLDALGYVPNPDDVGTLRDFSSDDRTNLVIETNVAMAHGYGSWMQGQQQIVLDLWPAQELYRAMNRKVPRDWHARWSDAGGEIFDGRMIALKNAPIWIEISRFGLPYPPFDFNSGMSVRDIGRDVAMKYGLVTRETRIKPETRDFNQNLQFKPAVLEAALRQALEDEGYHFDGDTLTL